MPAVPATTPNLLLPRFAADSSADIWVHLNNIVDTLDVFAGAWTAYTPTWTQSTGETLNVGDGTMTGRYWQFGKTLLVQIRLVRGASSDVGSTHWIFGLPPVTPKTWNMLGGGFSMARGSAAAFFGGSVFPVSSTGIGAIAGDLGRIGSNVPPTPAHASGDWYSLQVVLEAA